MSSGALPQVDGLQEILDRCQRLIRVHSVLRGSAETLCVLVVCVLLGCAIDYLIALPGVVRLAGLAATLVLTGAVAWKRLIHPMSGRVPAEELGAAVDLQFPELQEAIATLICVDDPAASSSEAGSMLMRDRLHQHVQSQIRSIHPSEVVQAQPTIKCWGLAALVLVMFSIPFLVWPTGSQLLLKRFMLPFANLAAPSNLFFDVPEGNRTVAANTDVQLIAIPRWRTKTVGVLPTDVVVELQTAAGNRDSLPMSYAELDSCFGVTLAGVRESVRYRICGGGATTEWFDLTVADPPRILAALLQETPPAYSGRPIEVFDGIVGDMHVFERSAIEMTLQFNKPVQNVLLEWKSWTSILNADSPEAASGFEPPLSPAVLSADGMSARFQFAALGTGQFEFRVEDALGLTNLNETTRRLIVTTDTPPKLTVAGINDGLEMRPTDVLPLKTNVVDDIGVGELEVHFRKNADAMRIEPAAGFDRGAVKVSHDFQIDLKTLDLHHGDTVTIKVKAADERPIPGPQIVWQGPWTIRISDQAEAIGQKALREADQQLIEALRRIEEQLQQDVAKGNELREKASRQWNEEAKQGVKELSEKEQTQGRELQKLAEQAASHPLMQKQAEKLTELAQQVRKDIPGKLDQAASAERDPAQHNIQESVSDLNRVREELHRATDEIEKAARLEQELAELNRLALEAQQLANGSQKLKEQRQNPQPEEGESQEELQQKLDKQQQQLQQDQQSLSDDLASLLQRRQELLQAAREAQLDRAAEIAEQVKRLALQQQQLAEAVNEEARDAARDAQQLADELQQARNEAAQLGDEIQKQAQDVERPEVQPLDQAIRDLRQGNLATPQDAIKKAQGELAKASENLQKPAAASDASTPAADENSRQEDDQQLTELNGKRQALGEKAAALNERLEQIEQKIAAMADELGAKPKASNADAADKENTVGEQPSESPTDSTEQKSADGPEASADPQTGEQPPQDVGKNLLNELGRMVDAARQTAEALKSDGKADNGAKQQAQQASDHAQEAMQQALAGQFSRSAEKMRNSANEAGRAAEQLPSPEMQDRQSQLQQQRDGFNRMADTLQQLQDNDRAQVAAQQETQRSVADEAQQLPTPLEELAERLNIPELGLQNQARPAQEAAQAAQEGAQAGDEASRQLNETQLQQAGQRAQEAAGHLNRAAQLAQQSAQGHRDPNAIIPTEVGESVNDALQSLRKASEAMDQEAAQRAAAEQQAQQSQQAGQGKPGESSNQQPGSEGQPGEGQQGEGQQGQPGEGEPGEGQSGSGQPGEGQPGEGEAGEGQPGTGQPGQSGEGQESGQGNGSPGKPGQGQQNSSAQQLSKVANALQSAARKALPNQFSPGQLNSDPGAAGGDPKGQGNTAEFDGQDPNATRGKSNRRQWGQLQDGLDADVRDGAKEILDSEYSELIRRYRRDLARQGQQSSK